MLEDFSKTRLRVLLTLAAALIALLCLAGCNKKSGEGVVLEKEYIPIKEATPTPALTPTAQPSVTQTEPTVAVESTGNSDEPAPNNESTPDEKVVSEIHEDEVNVDGYVMKKDVRGTSKDPRATDHESWIVRVQMVADLRRVDVHTDKARWQKLKAGDRVHVTYRQGKYTGTIWDSEIE